MSLANLISGLLFGSIGFVAFVYGKRQSNFKIMGIGALLIGYPYFIFNTIAVYLIGIALTVALFIFREWKDTPQQAAGYLFIPLSLTLSPIRGRGNLCGTPWQDHGEIYFIIDKYVIKFPTCYWQRWGYYGGYSLQIEKEQKEMLPLGTLCDILLLWG